MEPCVYLTGLWLVVLRPFLRFAGTMLSMSKNGLNHYDNANAFMMFKKEKAWLCKLL